MLTLFSGDFLVVNSNFIWGYILFAFKNVILVINKPTRLIVYAVVVGSISTGGEFLFSHSGNMIKCDAEFQHSEIYPKNGNEAILKIA